MCGVGREVVKLVRLYLSSFSLASCINSLSLSLARCNLSSQIRQVTFGKPGCKLTAVLILSGSSRRLCRLLYTRYAVVTLLVPAPPDNAPFNLYPPPPLDSSRFDDHKRFRELAHEARPIRIYFLEAVYFRAKEEERIEGYRIF